MYDDVPWLHVLTVLVADGGFAKQKIIAVATTKEDLKVFFEEWLKHNSRIYGGKYQLDYIPFVSETDDA